MKFAIALLLLFSALSITYAQNREVSPLPINWNDTSAFIAKQTDFYIGYHWMGSTPKIVNTLLHTNHYFEQWGMSGKRNLYLKNIPHR